MYDYGLENLEMKYSEFITTGILVEIAEYYNITIELMFAGVNMFLARLRLILARAAGEG